MSWRRPTDSLCLHTHLLLVIDTCEGILKYGLHALPHAMGWQPKLQPVVGSEQCVSLPFVLARGARGCCVGASMHFRNIGASLRGVERELGCMGGTFGNSLLAHSVPLKMAMCWFVQALRYFVRRVMLICFVIRTQRGRVVCTTCRICFAGGWSWSFMACLWLV